jgi:hypothetical protein
VILVDGTGCLVLTGTSLLCSNDAFVASAQDMQKKNERRQRFLMDKAELAKMATPTVDTKKLRVVNDEGELDLDAMVIKGTCSTVEKEYLRLTSAPHPSTVRPEPVLKDALALVKKKWKKGKCDYVYACSQLKSIRQDCTVQHIKNDFTVLVYETHARVALESGDINEFNQCQTQLHELYEKALPGQAIEFLAYRILYSVYVSLQAKKADSNAGVLGMYSVLSSITDKLRADPAVAHALAVRAAVAVNDYHRFFQLYVDAPNMAGFLMDPMVPAIRLAALRAMCKAYVLPSLDECVVDPVADFCCCDAVNQVSPNAVARICGERAEAGRQRGCRVHCQVRTRVRQRQEVDDRHQELGHRVGAQQPVLTHLVLPRRHASA